MTPLATRTKKRPAPRLSRRTILLVLAAAAILLSILALRSCLFGGPRTLPEQVQSQIPSWVDKQLLTPNPYSRPETPVQKSKRHCDPLCGQSRHLCRRQPQFF